MRIAVVTHAAKKIGGTETYIEALLPALERAGHAVAVVFESDGDLSRPPIQVPSQTQCWSIQDHGPTVALMRLMTWAPDVIYVHGLSDPVFEKSIQRIAPSVFYAHNFYGQCISGSKRVRFPKTTPCTRKFGAACLAHYLPRGCGGSSPITMLRQYSLQKRRLDLLHTYRRVLTNSQYLVSELAKHGVGAECIYLFAANSAVDPPALGAAGFPAPGQPWRLLFLGRADALKGGDLLLKSLPAVAKRTERALAVTFAADGPALREWKEIARQVSSDQIEVNFVGWSLRAADLFPSTHLLVMPSLWPEPFGLSGIEAGMHAVPAVAFASGGIPEWLRDGANGHLAPSDPPTAEGLASAISAAFSSPSHYLELRGNALARARGFTLSRHLDSLLNVFCDVAHSSSAREIAKAVAG